jgi:hypothetical protein
MRRQQLVLTAFTGLLLSGILLSCTYDELSPKKTTVPDEAKFSVDIIPILNANCNAGPCHSNGGQRPNLTEASAYNSLILSGWVDPEIDKEDPENSLLYQKISNGSMKIYLTDQERAIILKWIELGSENN